MNLRTVAAIAAGKAAAAASRLLGRGGGTAIAGLAALRVDPGIVYVLTSQAGAGAIATKRKGNGAVLSPPGATARRLTS